MRSQRGLHQKGFSLVELIAVMVIIAALAVTAFTRLIPSSTYQLQAARDQVLVALFTAQQYAMTRGVAVSLQSAGNQIDIREDTDGDGTPDSSITTADQVYPVALPANASVTAATLSYDRLGYTSPASLSVSAGGASVQVTVSETGYAE